jgi:hypothetical protein
LWDWNEAMFLSVMKLCQTGKRDTLCTLSRNELLCSETTHIPQKLKLQNYC